MFVNKYIKNILSKDETDLPLVDYPALLTHLQNINENITSVDYFTWYTKSLKTLLRGSTGWTDKKIKISQQKDDYLKTASTTSELPIIAIYSSEYENLTHADTKALFRIKLEIIITTDLSSDDSGLAYQIARRIRRVLSYDCNEAYYLGLRDDNEFANFGGFIAGLDFQSQNKNYNDQLSLIYRCEFYEI